MRREDLRQSYRPEDHDLEMEADKGALFSREIAVALRQWIYPEFVSLCGSASHTFTRREHIKHTSSGPVLSKPHTHMPHHSVT